MNIIENRTFDKERALYNLRDALVKGCTFAGPADGESALKESHNITVEDCSFSLRYPLWHSTAFVLRNSVMDDGTRAPLWYAKDGEIENCRIFGVKCLRECHGIRLSGCEVTSPEFGWKCSDITVKDCSLQSEYLFFESSDIKISGLEMKGKYSFQYTKGLTVDHSVLDTKDAFWHSKNAVIRNSTVKGEYLGWYSENLTLINCRITGTQPFCYCNGLKLENCTMEGADFAFECSDVTADIKGEVLSIKNPRRGSITVDGVGEIINEDPVMETDCKIFIRTRQE